MQKLKGRRTRVSTLALAPEHPYLAACDAHGETHIWDTSTGTLLAFFTLGHRYVATGPIHFLPDGRCFVPHDDGWTIVDAITKKQTTHKQRFTGSMTLSPDGRYVVCCGEDRVDREFRVHDLSKANKVVWELTPKQQTFLPFTPIVTADSQTIIAHEIGLASNEHPGHAIVTRRLKDGALVGRWPIPNMNLLHLATSADGQLLAGQTTRSVLLWKLAEPGSKPQKLVNPSKQHLVGMAMYPTGSKFATIANDRYVRVWDTTTLQPETTLEWDIGKLHAIAFSADGLRAAVGSGRGTVLVWDVE